MELKRQAKVLFRRCTNNERQQGKKLYATGTVTIDVQLCVGSLEDMMMMIRMLRWNRLPNASTTCIVLVAPSFAVLTYLS